ncbi:MAG: deoxyribodipyrimidine photo-lyase [Gaiellales bacterium]|nr:deoxyribodipyrimidine photo-lyase [Gaiellales bacterium]
MQCSVVLLTRDLRVHDRPALAAACDAAAEVVPLFVLDRTLLAHRPQGYPEPIVDHREAVARLRAIQETRG